MTMKTKTYIVLFTLLLAFCSNKDNEPAPPVNPPPGATFAKGADISWVTEMEAAGRKFYSAAGVETECLALLKSLGMNTVRLRVWVNPPDGWNNAADLV